MPVPVLSRVERMSAQSGLKARAAARSRSVSRIHTPAILNDLANSPASSVAGFYRRRSNASLPRRSSSSSNGSRVSQSMLVMELAAAEGGGGGGGGGGRGVQLPAV